MFKTYGKIALISRKGTLTSSSPCPTDQDLTVLTAVLRILRAQSGGLLEPHMLEGVEAQAGL
jgi:hypothetical protein